MTSSKIAALALAATTAFSLSACSTDTDATTDTVAPTETTMSPTEAMAPSLPTAEELNALLALAADPNVPVEEKTKTVQGGETVPELFQVMTDSKLESGAEFQVVQPILPGYTPDSVLATVNFMLPDREPQPAENVEFIYEDGHWKLSQSWACTLITNTVTPEQVPPLCNETLGNEPAAPENPGVPASPEDAEMPPAPPAA
ncbi:MULTISPECIES: hypothetical protein [unclassified Corynebacterium]|uniref:hypothetical protein n=1 Tax=unclassified Corynebacterium TaxID=2624378 RepID=UPI002168F686|nr:MULTISPECIES: hypothetical protein [unclassified Corynebacterium]MCS4489027.1 hypothetical protein [Corynebacterium sp. ES2775-CONJ]MCS4490840.1 hypothetical protein [Corynebacterium sp. ES2715-CONJ3]MCS4531277.1 hypothetical protein [Corynebacterium sp. ES2730-CONJ]